MPEDSSERLKVFISYTRESAEHDQCVADLARRIISELAFDCELDQFHANQNWPQWMEERLEWADRVLIIATETYHRRWRGKEKKGVGLGAKWESLLTRQHLYDYEGETDKFVPVVFSRDNIKHIPRPLRGYTRVEFTPGGDLEPLRRRLLGIPPIEKPQLPPVAPLLKHDEQYFPAMQSATGRRPVTREAGADTFNPASIGVVNDPEEIISNLFPIQYSPNLYRAVLFKRKRYNEFKTMVETAWEMSGRKGPVPLDYHLEGKTVYRLEPFSDEPWLSLIRNRRLASIDPIPTTSWAHSDVFADKTLFIKLLNRCLTTLCRTHDMDFSKDLDCHLFIKRGPRSRSLKVKALTKSGTRDLYKAIPDKTSRDPSAILHWQHQAFRHRFVRCDLQWYLVVTPFWAFTSDGLTKKSRFQNSWSSKLRKPERNRAALGHVLLWREVLSRDADMLRTYPALQIKPPISLISQPSIRDKEWIAFARGEEKKILEQNLETILPDEIGPNIS